ncbi:hypothetical protein LBWT_28290 [Leptolyngbya boryana IAM M-101]|nr:hypothetical protein LBWT_28290 [Leptolyngbya boryana IAM M-101]BAS63250.1 hypothetical protein LBDG_28290 [Leptolyngbya boryana dg5]
MARFSFNSVLLNMFIVLIFILSFRAFAGFLAPDFDADQAVHVMMAYDLQLPEDLYYWGQSRLGSLLPIVSHWLLKISPFSPLEVVSYVQYGFLAISFFCFIRLFRKPITKVVFALICFLPPQPFLKLVEVAHPYAPQFALLGIALVSADQLITSPESNTIKKNVLSFVALVSLILSVWVSDLSLVPKGLAAILVVSTFLQRYRKSNKQNRFVGETLAHQSQDATLKLLRTSSIVICTFVTLLLGSAFLVYAKSTASQQDENYGILAINGLDVIADIVRSILVAVSHTFLFQVGNPFLSLYAIAVLGLVFVLAYYWFQARHTPVFTNRTYWIPFFLGSAIGSFFLILLSRWTLIQSTPPRYFIGIYIFLWLSALIVFDNLRSPELIRKNALRRVTTLLVLTALLGSLSLPEYVFALEKPQSRFSMLQPIATLGQAGFIGEYWASYLMCIVAPEQTSCTPHDQSFFRCGRCVQAVLASPIIYLVERDWLESFPEEIEQFGQRLEKQGKVKKIAGYWMAPYRNMTVSKN